MTDEGISHVGHMTTLQSLTLSRTKLTDQGMPYLTGTPVGSVITLGLLENLYSFSYLENSG